MSFRTLSIFNVALLLINLCGVSANAGDDRIEIKSRVTEFVPAFKKYNPSDEKRLDIQFGDKVSIEDLWPNRVELAVSLSARPRNPEEFGQTWWTAFNYKQLLIWAESPVTGATRDLPIVVIFTDFPASQDFKNPGDYEAYVRRVIQDLRHGFQQENLEANLSRTHFIIDSKNNWLDQHGEELKESKKLKRESGIQVFDGPQVLAPSFYTQLILDNAPGFWIYTGYNFLDLEVERIQKIRDLAQERKLDESNRLAIEKANYYSHASRFDLSRLNDADEQAPMFDDWMKKIVGEFTDLIPTQIQRSNVWMKVFERALQDLRIVDKDFICKNLNSVIRQEVDLNVLAQAHQLSQKYCATAPTTSLSKGPMISTQYYVVGDDLVLKIENKGSNVVTAKVTIQIEEIGKPKVFSKTEEVTLGVPNSKFNRKKKWEITLYDLFPLEKALGDVRNNNPFKRLSVELVFSQIGQPLVTKTIESPFIYTGELTNKFIDRTADERLKMESQLLFVTYFTTDALETSAKASDKFGFSIPEKLDPSKAKEGKLIEQASAEDRQWFEETFKSISQALQESKLEKTDRLLLPKDWSAPQDVIDCFTKLAAQKEGTQIQEIVACAKTYPLVFDFSAPWCAPCKDSVPYSNDLLSSEGKKGLLIVNVQLLAADPAARSKEERTAIDHMAELDFPMLILSRENQRALKVMKGNGHPIPVPTYLYKRRTGDWLNMSLGGSVVRKFAVALVNETLPLNYKTGDQIPLSKELSNLLESYAPFND